MSVDLLAVDASKEVVANNNNTNTLMINGDSTDTQEVQPLLDLMLWWPENRMICVCS